MYCANKQMIVVCFVNVNIVVCASRVAILFCILNIVELTALVDLQLEKKIIEASKTTRNIDQE